jgi:hypothetical protein
MAKNTNPKIETKRMRYAFWLAVVGLALSATLVIFLVVVAKMRTSADIVAIIGVFTSLTGTLVGTFFGVQVGSAGREQEREDRKQMETMAMKAIGNLNPEMANQIMKDMEDK